MSESTLKEKAIHGVLWSAVDKCFVRIVALIISIILARLLSPGDYGLIGMLSIFIILANLLIDSGFSQALVQKYTPSEDDYSTAFYFNVGIGLFCYIILYLVSPFIAKFFGIPLLCSLLRVLSLVLITNSLTVVQRAKLLIKIDFRTQSIINITATFVSGGIAIWAAYVNHGVWALVIQTVSKQFLMMVLYWLLGKWWPKKVFLKESFYSLFRFGSKLLAAGMVATLVTNIYNIVIGKLYKASELGFYTKGYELSEVSSGTINEIINSVTFPLLSSVREERGKLISVYSKMLGMTAFIIIPSMSLFAILAEPFVSVILTDKWLPAVPIIQWLCMARLFTPISALNMNILNALGRSDLYMKVDFSKLPLTLFVMIITLPISIKAVVIGNFLSTFICYFINAYLPGKILGFGIKAQTYIFRKIIISTICMSLVTMSVLFMFESQIIKLFLGFIVGLLSYLYCSKILHVLEMKEFEFMLKQLFVKIIRFK